MNRRRSKFERFCRSYGVERLAAGLQIQSSAVYHWLRGSTAPRRTIAAILIQLAREAGVRLTLDQIYQHARDLARQRAARETSVLQKSARMVSTRPSHNASTGVM